MRNRSILGQVFNIASDRPLENLHQLFYVHFINSWKHLAPLLVCLDPTAIVNWHHLLTRTFICTSDIQGAFFPKNDKGRCSWTKRFRNPSIVKIGLTLLGPSYPVVSHASLVLRPGWQKLGGGTGGPRRKVWNRTKILSPNIRYFVAN